MKAMSEKSIEKQLIEKKYKILGQIEVSDEEYEDLLEYTKVQVKFLDTTPNPYSDLRLSLALVQIAIRCYREGKYWEYFISEIGKSLTSSECNYIGQIFARTVSNHNLFELFGDSSSNMYVENIKAHSFVTNYYIHGLFDFAYAFFENNLFRNISDELEEDIQSLSRYLQGTLGSTNDKILEKGSEKKAEKAYKLLKSTRAVLAQAEFRTVYEIFYPILLLIDKYYYEDEVPIVTKNRYEEYFKQWCEQQHSVENNQTKAERSIRKVVSHKPFIKIDINKNLAFLVIPPQKFRGEDCSGQVFVTVEINGYEEKRELELYYSLGMYISEEMIIPISNIFEEINIKIYSILEKKIQFKRMDYRIFNLSWEGIDRFAKGKNYLLVKKGISVTSEKEEDCLDYTDEYSNWQYFSININEQSVFYIGRRPVSIIGEFSPEPVYQEMVENFSVYNSQGQQMVVTREHPIISIIIAGEKMQGSALIVHQNKLFLKEICEKTVYELPEDNKKYVININLEEILQKEDGYYQVKIDVPGEKKKVYEYLLLRSFSCKLDKKIYVFEERGSISIKKALHENCLIPTDWGLEYETASNAKYNFPISLDMNEVKFRLILNSEVYDIQLPINVFSYGFSKVAMKSQSSEYLWYTELSENLYLKIPEATNVYAYWMKNKEERYEAELLSSGLFRIDISELIRKVQREYKLRWQYINLAFHADREYNIPLPAILRNLMVTPYFKLEIDEQGIYMDLHIKGNAELLIKIIDKHTSSVLIEDKKVEQGRNYFNELTVDGFYDILPTMVEEDEFGLDVKTTELKKILGTGIVDINYLVNCRLPIKEITRNGELLELVNFYLVNIDEMIDEDKYQGALIQYHIKEKEIQWEDKKELGKVRILIFQKDAEIKFSLSIYSYDEEEWYYPYYDSHCHRILNCDDDLLRKSKDYDRFEEMEEKVDYIVDIDRIRRIK